MENNSSNINQRILKILEWILGSLLLLLGLLLCYAGEFEVGLPYVVVGAVLLPISSLPGWFKALLAIAGVVLGIL